MSQDRPIVVTGSPRVGKSLVARILAESGEFVRVPEPLSIWDLGMTNRPDDCRTADEATEEIRSAISRGCQGAVGSQGAGRYLDDLAYHALRIPFLFAVLDDVRVIHVVRDARTAIPEMLYGWTYRDTVGRVVKRRVSGLKLQTLPRLAFRFAKNYLTVRLTGGRATWGPRVPGLLDYRESHSMAEVAAFQWMQMVSICRDDLRSQSGDCWLEVKHEDLIADPHAVGVRIGRFVESVDAETIGELALAQVDQDLLFDKKVAPTGDEWRLIDQMIGPLRRELGYDQGRAGGSSRLEGQ